MTVLLVLMASMVTLGPLFWFLYSVSQEYIEFRNNELMWVKMSLKEQAELEMELDAWKDQQWLKKHHNNST